MTGDRTADDRIEAIRVRLTQTGEAHHRYEKSELNGVYDQQWPAWYAAYAVDHGIGESIGHPVTADELAAYFASTNVEFEAIQPSSTEPWAAYTARRMATEL